MTAIVKAEAGVSFWCPTEATHKLISFSTRGFRTQPFGSAQLSLQVPTPNRDTLVRGIFPLQLRISYQIELT